MKKRFAGEIAVGILREVDLIEHRLLDVTELKKSEAQR